MDDFNIEVKFKICIEIWFEWLKYDIKWGILLYIV